MTLDENGAERSCKYETSLSPKPAEGCGAKASARSQARGDARAGVYSKLTFERRFSPGGRPDSGRLQPGDKLLARQVMFLNIDPTGSVQGCRVVATSGDLPAHYGCAEAKSERFQAKANAATEPARQAFMTVLVYGHTEQIA